MAEGIDPRNEEMLQKIADFVNKFGTQTKGLGDRLNALDKKYLEHQMVTGRYTNDIKENAELTKQLNLRKNQFERKYIEDYKKFADDQRRLVKAKEITDREAADNIKGFNERILKEIDNPELRNTFIEFTKNLDSAAERSRRFEAILGENGDRLQKTFLTVGSNILNATNQIVQSYRDTGSQTKFATTILSEGASATGSILQTMGGAASATGEAVSGLGRKGRIAGVALQGLGALASLAGTGIKEIAQKALPFLSAELEKNLLAFQSLSSSGALFSNGLTGMIEVAGTAGMTLDMFNNVVKNNTTSLAGLGEGVSAGATRAARALQAGGDGMRKQLLSLGYSIEEQGTLVAETMLDMRQGAKNLVASDAEVAEQTKKYAENLRIIASVTGEDAKKKMDQARQAAQDLAFQQQLQGMDAKQRQEVINAMANMNEVEKKAFQEMVVFGQVITPSLAATVTQSQSLQAKLGETLNQFNQGTLSAGSFQDLSKQYNEGIRQDLLAARGVAQAGAAGVGGVIGDMYKAMNTVFQDVLRQSPEALEAAQKAAKEQKDTSDAMTSSMNEVAKAQVAAAQEIQKAILNSGVMTGFATATKEATEAVTALIKKFNDAYVPPAAGAASAESERARNEAAGRAMGDTAGGIIGGIIGSAFGPGGAIAGAMLGAMAGGAVGGAVGRTTTITEEQRSQLTDLTGQGGIPGFARGGVVDAPKTGMLAKLHGREMVLPLPQNLEANAFSELLGNLSDLQKSMSQQTRADVTPNKINDYLATLTEAQRQIAVEQMTYGQAVTPESALTASMIEEINSAFIAERPADKVMLATNQNMVDVMVSLSEKMDELLRATRDVVVNTDRTARGVA